MAKRTKCKYCRKALKPSPKKSGWFLRVYAADPYCSRKCCERDHGIMSQPSEDLGAYAV